MDQVKLSIIILNYKTKDLLRLLLKNLIDLNIEVSHEVIVVDNASNDGSVKMVEQLFPQIKVIANNKNSGHAAGNNLGIKAANGEYLVIMNTDIIFFKQKDIIDILQYMDSNADIGMVGPKLLNGDGSVQNSCFRPYTAFTPIFRRTPLGKLSFAKRDLANHLMEDFKHNELREVEWILGACLIIKKSALEKCGSFNEKLFLYFADYELCDRLRHYGYKIMYYPDVHINL